MGSPPPTPGPPTAPAYPAGLAEAGGAAAPATYPGCALAPAPPLCNTTHSCKVSDAEFTQSASTQTHTKVTVQQRWGMHVKEKVNG